MARRGFDARFSTAPPNLLPLGWHNFSHIGEIRGFGPRTEAGDPIPKIPAAAPDAEHQTFKFPFHGLHYGIKRFPGMMDQITVRFHLGPSEMFHLPKKNHPSQTCEEKVKRRIFCGDDPAVLILKH
ncbi:para-nitrophenol 4-monooxygenase [Aspergillus lentulus]|nr:para-nitrophenol 4-monooxygenase [Aspergillus lentulus]